MPVYYIDFNGGLDSNDGLSEATPRKTFPGVGANGDVYRLKRGSVYYGTSQIGFGTRQGVLFTDYGNPAAPKPAIEAIHAASSSTINHTGDAIWHNVELRNFQRSPAETTDSNTGQNAIYFGTRGNVAPGTAEGVSGVIVNCDFKQIGNNAISFNGIGAESQAAFASPIGIVLGCSFDGIGGDGVFGSLRDLLEVGWCTFRDMGNRIEPLITGTPPGGRQGSSDMVGLGSVCPTLVWVHDNHMDHSHWDCKHSIMLDAPAAGAGNLAIIERNVIIGYGASLDRPFVQSVNNVGINTQIRTLLRHNYIRGSRILLNIDAQVPWVDAYSNIFDVLGIDGANPAIGVFGDNVTLRGNSIIGRGKINGTAVASSFQAARFSAYQNLIQGFSKGFAVGASAEFGYFRNAFFDVDMPYFDGSVAMALGQSDIVVPTPTIKPGAFTSNDARLMFRQVDRRVPDFWGRFGPDGVAHIGATLGVF